MTVDRQSSERGRGGVTYLYVGDVFVMSLGQKTTRPISKALQWLAWWTEFWSGALIKLHTSMLGTFFVYTFALSMPIFKKKSLRRFLEKSSKLFIVVCSAKVCTKRSPIEKYVTSSLPRSELCLPSKWTCELKFGAPWVHYWASKRSERERGRKSTRNWPPIIIVSSKQRRFALQLQQETIRWDLRIYNRVEHLAQYC